MRYCVKRTLCLLVCVCTLLTLTAAFTLSTTASLPSKGPMVDIGNEFIIVQTASGEIWGWGDNSTGVLGTASAEINVTSPTKIALPQNVTSVSISAGFDHVLMLASDGNVYAWGNNEVGQLGNENAEKYSTPTLVEELCDKNVVAISAGYRFSLALTEGGRVYAFGLNDKLQLGYESTPEFSATPTRINALGGVFVKQINAGYNSVTAVDINGKVYLWGCANNGVLGYEDFTENHLPTALPDSKNALPIVRTDISASHSAYLQNDGTVGFMGLNKYGQYGNGSTDQTPSVRFKTSDTSALDVIEIAISDTQTVLLTANGKVYTAGARNPNDINSASNTFVPLFGDATQAPAAIAIDAGYKNGALIAQDGSVWTWGANSCGQLGNGTTSEGQATPTKVFVDSDFDVGQAPTVMSVPIRVTTSVPAPTYAITIPATIDIGELRQTDETDPNRHSLNKFTVTATNVDNLFGEKEICVSVTSGNIDGTFCLQDESGNTLPFELFREANAQTSIASGDVFARFDKNGSVDTWIRIDQSKITESGIYNGVLIFSYAVESID